MFTLIIWLKQCLSDFFTVKLLPPLSVLYCLKGIYYVKPLLQKEEVLLYSLKVFIYIYELFGILLYGRITWSYSLLIDEYSYIKEYLHPSISPIHPRFNQDLYQHRFIHIIL